MGYLTGRHLVANVHARDISSFTIGTGTLLSLSISTSELRVNDDPWWCEIGILSGGVSFEQRATVLGTGLLTNDSSISWTGILPIDDDSFAYSLLNGPGGFGALLTAFVTRDLKGKKANLA